MVMRWHPVTRLVIAIIILTVVLRANRIEAQNADPLCNTGISSRAACCPLQCGQCGGEGCHKKSVALKTKCCVNGIISSNTFCHSSLPPCRLVNEQMNAEVPPSQSPPKVSGPHDTTMGSWRVAAVREGNVVVRHEACAVMVNGLVVLVGGRGYNKATSIYNPATQTWRTGAGPGKGVEIHHFQCVSADGKVWVVSSWTGRYPFEANNDVMYVYDVSRDEWTTRAGMPPQRRRAASAAVRRGSWIYVVAGNRGGHGSHATSLTWFDAYNWRTDTWLPPGSLPNMPGGGRDHVGAALVNGELCVAGGRDGGTSDFFNRAIPTTFCYNFESKQWSQKEDFPLPRAGAMTGASCDGRMVVAGGEGNGRAYKRVDVFNGAKWIEAPSLTRARHGSGLAVAACRCGHLFIPSGSGNQGGSPELSSTEQFVPSTSANICYRY